jgi:hypothetical protein
MAERSCWSVEKFVPTRCPNPQCKHPFDTNGENGFLIGTFWLHETPEETRKILASIRGVPAEVVVCAKCCNYTIKVNIERRVYPIKSLAEQALKVGYRNLTECRLFGIEQLHCIVVTRYLEGRGTVSYEEV